MIVMMLKIGKLIIISIYLTLQYVFESEFKS